MNGKALTTAGAVLGTIPGISIIFNHVVIPVDDRALYLGIAPAVGIVVTLFVWTRVSQIARLSQQRLTGTVIALSVVAVVTFLGYMRLRDLCVVQHEDDQLLFPIVLHGELKALCELAGGRAAAIDDQGISRVRDEILKWPGGLTVSRVGLLGAAQLWTSALIALVNLLAVRVQVSAAAASRRKVSKLTKRV